MGYREDLINQNYARFAQLEEYKRIISVKERRLRELTDMASDYSIDGKRYFELCREIATQINAIVSCKHTRRLIQKEIRETLRELKGLKYGAK